MLKFIETRRKKNPIAYCFTKISFLILFLRKKEKPTFNKSEKNVNLNIIDYLYKIC